MANDIEKLVDKIGRDTRRKYNNGSVSHSECQQEIFGSNNSIISQSLRNLICIMDFRPVHY